MANPRDASKQTLLEADARRVELPPLELTESPSWRQRTLRPVGPGSLRGSVLNLATAAIGAGCLAMPYAIAESGLVVGCVWLVLAMALHILSCEVLLGVSQGVRTWPQLFISNFGGGGWVMDVIMLFLCAGVVIMYWVVEANQMSTFFSAGDADNDPHRPYYIMGVAALVLPVTLFELAFLRYVSLFVLCVCSSLTIFVPVMSLGCDTPAEMHYRVWPTSALGALQGFFICIFCSMIHINFYSVFGAMAPPPPWSPRQALPKDVADTLRMQKSFRIAVVIAASINAVLGLGGYFTLGSAAPQDLLQAYTEERCRPWAFGIATSLRTAIAVCTLGSIAINVAALRTAFLSLTLLKEVVTPQRPGVWALVTLALVVATVAAGIVCKNVADIVGVLGGTLSTIVVFLIPLLAYARNGVGDGACQRAGKMAVLAVVSLAGFANVIAKFFVQA